MAFRLALVVAAVACGAAAVALSRGGDAPARPVAGTAAPRLPAAPKPAFEIGAPVALARHPHETTWAAVRRDVVARARPSASARAVASLAARTPEGTTNIVIALARRALWVRVRAGGAAGWVPRSALGAYGIVRTHLVVDVAARTATLLRDGRRVMKVPVGVGTAQAPTPRGEFVIRNRLTRYRSAFYGPVALGTDARTKLTDWPGGGFVGIHGTDQPGLIPGRISHGCVRMRNADVVRLAGLAPAGTPLTIR